MQSAEDAIHLLPALPDVWTEGSIRGLRAKGGFEIVEMQWKDAKLVKLLIKSNLGGNLRLRLPNELKLSTGATLGKAQGKNPNQFYQLEEIRKPIIAEKSTIQPLELKETFLFDVATQKGKVYTFSVK
jgi:alpha-L-fucosidase 2